MKNKHTSLMLSVLILTGCFSSLAPNSQAVPIKRDETQFKEEPITKVPELPYVPMYPGKGAFFVDGNNYPYIGSGKKCMTIRFRAKELPEDVRTWYRGAMAQYGWTVDDKQCTANYLTGVRRKEGLMLNVFTQNVRYKAKDGQIYRCMYTIRYLEEAPSHMQ